MGIIGATAAVGVAAAGAQLAGSSMAAGAAKDASSQQMRMFERTRGDLAPFIAPGGNALRDAYTLAQLGPTGGGRDYIDLAYQNLPGRMTQAELEATPGYQFTRDQGLKSVQNAAAARGLGVSGASLKGAAEYATGLANKTYLDQFNVRQKQFEDFVNLNSGQQGQLTNQYNRLAGIATIGANAATQQATAGTAAANTAGKYTTEAGNLQGSGVINAGNAATSSLNNYLAYDAYKNRTAALSGPTSGYTDLNNS